jgi:energy-coupling factor transport system substrate-specific component
MLRSGRAQGLVVSLTLFFTSGILGLLLYRFIRSSGSSGTVAPPSGPAQAPVTRRTYKIPQSYIAAIVPLAAALNLVGGYIINTFRLPIFLDMLGTAVTAFTVGPWWGAVTGIITNIGESLIISPIYLPFAVVNVAGAIVWGYAARYGWGKDFVRLLVLGVVVAVVSSLIAVPIIVFVFGGATGVPNDVITAALIAAGGALFQSAFISNIIASLSDKIISTFLAVAIVAALPPILKSRVQLAQYSGLKAVGYSLVGIIIGVAIMVYIILTTHA